MLYLADSKLKLLRTSEVKMYEYEDEHIDAWDDEDDYEDELDDEAE